MNIDQMPAGREMDTLVAQEVMGWHCWNTEQGPCYKTADGQYVRGAHTWSPSTSIADAWEVVEFLIGIRKLLSIHPHMFEWSCEWAGGHHAYAKTAPLAICRAALKAVGA